MTEDLFTSSWCYKTYFGGNLDFHQIKKFDKVWSGVWTCTKMWKPCNFKAKLDSRTVYCSLNGLFMWF